MIYNCREFDFFFKQKTAYEMLISDWSSDVCSSDLFDIHNVSAMGVFKREEYARGSMFKNFREDWVFRATYDYDTRYLFEVNGAYKIGRASCRERVCQYV